MTDSGDPGSPPGRPTGGWQAPRTTAVLVLADGTVIEGHGLGAHGAAVGEVCFNTAMTGYQEILTDPSYAGQIITFTFPHIGNVGTNEEDIETSNLAASSGVRGCVLKADITNPSNWRASRHLDQWLKPATSSPSPASIPAPSPTASAISACPTASSPMIRPETSTLRR
jgi:carbamoyl-phosphate synthase small subunit